MWRARLIAGVVVAALIIVGAGFLLTAAYLALKTQFTPTVAALLLGLFLVGAGALVSLAAMLINATSATARRGVVPLPVTATQPAVVEDLQSAEALAQQFAVLLRNLNPVTIAVLGAGILVGLLKRR